MERPPSKWELRAHELGMKALAGTATDAERDEYSQGRTRRAEPVQHEQTDARILAIELGRRWYEPGITCHTSEMGGIVAGLRRQAMGGGTGYPDYTLVIPASATPNWRELVEGMPDDAGALIAGRRLFGKSCALELKAEGVRPRTARGGPEQRGGLSEDQAWCLRNMCDAGWLTCVAYGWEMALAALDAWAGPEPAELPRGWAERRGRGGL